MEPVIIAASIAATGTLLTLFLNWWFLLRPQSRLHLLQAKKTNFELVQATNDSAEAKAKNLKDEVNEQLTIIMEERKRQETELRKEIADLKAESRNKDVEIATLYRQMSELNSALHVRDTTILNLQRQMQELLTKAGLKE